jgi:hypothetical protein
MLELEFLICREALSQHLPDVALCALPDGVFDAAVAIPIPPASNIAADSTPNRPSFMIPILVWNVGDIANLGPMHPRRRTFRIFLLRLTQ